MNARFARQRLGTQAPVRATDVSQKVAASNGSALVQVPTNIEGGTEAPYPKVLLAILAKQKESVLPLYLMCIDALDYPKDSIVIYVRTNNNTDRTAIILKSWLARVGHQYSHVEFDNSNVAEPVDRFGTHEWNAIRFGVLAKIRHESMRFALQCGCDFYFVVDVDNFLKPHTLRDLIKANVPIVAPLLRHQDPRRLYSNYHEKVNPRGYFLDSDEYNWILFQRVRGLCQVPVVHCTYLVRRDVIPLLSYEDGSERHEYVIFSDSARQQGIPQYLDNRDVYGYLTLEERTGQVAELLGVPVAIAAKRADIAAAQSRARGKSRGDIPSAPPIFIHSSWRTSSTWFWSKFRQLPETLAFYEPLTMFLNTITRAQALAYDHDAWGSGHSATDPYFLEFVPLIRRTGGVQAISWKHSLQLVCAGRWIAGRLEERGATISFPATSRGPKARQDSGLGLLPFAWPPLCDEKGFRRAPYFFASKSLVPMDFVHRI